MHSRDFNPRAPRGARLQLIPLCRVLIHISIHVPREGHDDNQRNELYYFGYISIHVPREGHDQIICRFVGGSEQFQSTCPARGTTRPLRVEHMTTSIFQSTCPARGTTAQWYKLNTASLTISIHVPREGHDYDEKRKQYRKRLFQSTCPARGTTGFDALVAFALVTFQSTCPARGTTQ